MTISVNANRSDHRRLLGDYPCLGHAYSNPINYPVILVVNGGGGAVPAAPVR